MFNGTQVETIFSVGFKTPSQRQESVWHQIADFSNNKQKTAPGRDPKTFSKNTFYNRLETCNESELPSGCQNISISVKERVAKGKSVWVDLERKDTEDVKSTDTSRQIASTDEEDQPQDAKITVTEAEFLNLEEEFIVFERLGGGRARKLAANAAKTRNLKLLPWAGVAAQISRDGKGVTSDIARSGRAFCFLPLPVLTGLPVQVSSVVFVFLSCLYFSFCFVFCLQKTKQYSTTLNRSTGISSCLRIDVTFGYLLYFFLFVSVLVVYSCFFFLPHPTTNHQMQQTLVHITTGGVPT